MGTVTRNSCGSFHIAWGILSNTEQWAFLTPSHATLVILYTLRKCAVTTYPCNSQGSHLLKVPCLKRGCQVLTDFSEFFYDVQSWTPVLHNIWWLPHCFSVPSTCYGVCCAELSESFCSQLSPDAKMEEPSVDAPVSGSTGWKRLRKKP